MAFRRGAGGFLLAVCAVIIGTGQAVAQTVLLNPVAITSANFTYGNLSFAITSCNAIYVGGSVSCSEDSTKIEGISTGRGETEIEIVAPSSYTQSGGQANSSLTFGLSITDLKGSNGLSSVSNILSATVGNKKDDSLVSSVLSGFNVTASPTSITSAPGALTSNTSFSLTKGTVSFNVALNLDSSGAQSGDMLTLSNVELLFKPAPEPASLTVLAVGLGGLLTARLQRRRQPTRGSVR